MDGNVDFLQEKEKVNRLSDYKTRSLIFDQEKRRLDLLSNQKRRREKAFNAVRNSELLSDWDCEYQDEDQEEAMEWSNTTPRKARLKEMFMLSEWMMSVPEDFETKWMFVICPVGKRCLVRCSKGSTSVYGKRGQRLAKFQSALPNGSQRDVSGCRYSNAEVTILDCIWSAQTKCYYVLDLLSWKGQVYMDTEKNFRVFWIKSKLEETPDLCQKSDRNTYPFVPLEYHTCDLSSICSALSNPFSHPLHNILMDGLLFYHSEGFYTPGLTPLALWLKPFMLSEVFSISVPEVFEHMKPDSYINMEYFIMEYEDKQTKKKRKNKRCKKSKEIVDETEELL